MTDTFHAGRLFVLLGMTSIVLTSVPCRAAGILIAPLVTLRISFPSLTEERCFRLSEHTAGRPPTQTVNGNRAAISRANVPYGCL